MIRYFLFNLSTCSGFAGEGDSGPKARQKAGSPSERTAPPHGCCCILPRMCQDQRCLVPHRRPRSRILSVCIRVHPWPRTNLRKLTERQRKQAIWPRMDTDTHGCGVSASSRSTGRRLEQNCMVIFWRNAILVFILLWNLALNTINPPTSHVSRPLYPDRPAAEGP